MHITITRHRNFCLKKGAAGEGYLPQSTSVFSVAVSILTAALVLPMLTLSQESQTPAIRIDSIRALLGKPLPDTTRLNTLIDLADLYAGEQPKLARHYFQKSLELAIRIRDREAEVTSRYGLGRYYKDIHQADSAYTMITQALDIGKKFRVDPAVRVLGHILAAQSIDHIQRFDLAMVHLKQAWLLATPLQRKDLEAAILTSKAGVFQEAFRSDSALLYYLKAEAMYRQMKEVQHHSTVLSNIGLLYLDQENYHQAIPYLKQGIQLAKQTGKTSELCRQYNTLGIVYEKLEFLDSALDAHRRSLHYAGVMRQPMDSARSYLNMGTVLKRQGAYSQAERSFSETLRISGRENSDMGRMYASINLANLELDQRKYPQALPWARTGYQLSVRLQEPAVMMEAARTLYDIFKHTGQSDSALAYFEIRDSLEGEIQNQEVAVEVARIQAAHASEMQEMENQHLTIQNQNKARVIHRQRLLGVAIILLLLATLLYSLALRRQRARLRQLNARLSASNAEIKAQAEEIKLLNESKDKMYAIIAHDLRNPFTGILGYSDLLEQQALTDGNAVYAEHVGRIRQSALRYYSLLQDLLHWATSQQGLLSVQESTFNVATLLREVIANHEDAAGMRHLVLRHSVPAEAQLKADRQLMHTVFSNLISNAIIHSRNAKEVIVRTSQTEGWVEFIVEDDGLGIQEETLRALHTLDGIPEGLRGYGLGLAICREFLSLHQGELVLKTNEGKGTTAVVRLPVCRKGMKE
ncbi:MAG TPA: tetratricopeptide repeat-containing sensor histidine kinase [Bacteroidales bacterium]|nr:tetratricopeptide repeat-containing sensor histidine kinase [Bacteroidales bacterium]